MTRDTLIVTGSRECRDVARIFTELDALRPMFSRLVHGACDSGADVLADQWAKHRGVERVPYRVEHELDGPWPGAGPRRNRRMLACEHWRCVLVVGFTHLRFPDVTRGTGGTIRRAQRMNLRTSVFFGC